MPETQSQFDKLNRYHRKSIAECSAPRGGTVRGRKGRYVVDLCRKQILYVWTEELKQPADTILIEEEKSFDVQTKRGYVPTKIDLSVSIRVSGNWVLVFCTEVKAYIEATMLKRTLLDALDIHRSTNGSVKYFPVFVLERCVSDEVMRGAEDTLQALTNDDTVQMRLFPVCDGTRDAHKEIHDPEYFKPLNKVYVDQFIGYVNNILAPHAATTAKQ